VRAVLPGGAVVIAKETNKTPAVAIHLSIRCGTEADPEEKVGAAYLLARVIDRGTTTRSADEIADALESRGVSLTTSVNRHVLSLSCTCLSADFDLVLELLADIVMSPSFPESEIATRKGEMVTAIRQDEDSPAARAMEALMAALYGTNHPYGRRMKGTPDIVNTLTRDDLVKLHADRFAPKALSAVVVGDVTADRAIRVAEGLFGSWAAAPQSSLPIWPVQPAERRTQKVFPMPGKSQAEVAYGFVTIRRNDPDYYAFWLMNNILGQYAMGGRLGSSIRERQGMAYSIGSVLDANIVEGPLIVRAGVSPTNVGKAIASIDEELTRMRSEGATVRELRESRQYLVGSMPRALETNAGIAAFLQTAEFFQLGLDYDVRLPDLLGSVTLDAVRDAAIRAFDPARATIVVAEPRQE
jgi:zinc protease